MEAILADFLNYLLVFESTPACRFEAKTSDQTEKSSSIESGKFHSGGVFEVAL